MDETDPIVPGGVKPSDNTVVTIATEEYLWGAFMMIASMRRHGMQEPVLIGTRHVSSRMQDVLRQLGGVRFFSLENTTYSPACYKPLLMLQTKTPYITWVNADGFFTGNCSGRLPPLLPDQIHLRMLSPDENPLVFRGFTKSGEDGSTIPEAILNAWRDDVAGLSKPMITRSCCSYFISVHESARDFLRKWHYQMMAVLPAGDPEDSDPALRFYHLLAGSVLNSVLAFWPQAPRVSAAYALDKDPEACYVHFDSPTKPWNGWSGRTFPYFDRYTEVLQWVQDNKLETPGPVPFALKRRHRALCAVGQCAISACSLFKRVLGK